MKSQISLRNKLSHDHLQKLAFIQLNISNVIYIVSIFLTN